MKENELTGIFNDHPVLGNLSEAIESRTGRINLSGLSGSLRSVAIARIFHDTTMIHVAVIPEKEDAAYLYNDLVSLTGGDSIFFFPSTYKRSVQYEQTEPANIVLRTEVLNHLASGKRKGIIVTYPESVMEKVISRRNLKKNTLNRSTGRQAIARFP